MQTALALAVLVLLALIAAQVAASRWFRARILTLAADLRRAPPTRPQGAALPPLVAAHVRRAGADPARPLRLASFNQSAEMRLKPGGPFTRVKAWQVIALGRGGFVWDARSAGARLRVMDAWVDGRGRLEARAFGAIPVTRAEGPEIDEAEALRYLAELPWAPDAILGNPDLSWQQSGPATAVVTMTVAGQVLQARFRFDDAGDIVGVEVDGRPSRDPDGRMVRRDWRGRFWDYRQIGERRLPAQAEAGHVLDGGYEVSFRAEIADYQLLP
jgi:hypothetical protein